MMSDVDSLYRDVILDHYKRPRNFRALEDTPTAEGHNPLCGDRLTVFVRVAGGVIDDVSFHGFGCAIATASASLMTESVRHKTLAEAAALGARFERMVSAAPDAPIDDLGELSALAGVRRFPMRLKCATLPWHAFRAAAAACAAVVSTE